MIEPDDYYRFVADDRERAVLMYQQGEITVQAIADELGVTRATVNNWLTKAGVIGQRRGKDPAPATTDVASLAHEVQELRTELRQSGSFHIGDLIREVREMRTDVDNNAHRLAALDSTVARLVGLVEGALITLRQERQES